MLKIETNLLGPRCNEAPKETGDDDDDTGCFPAGAGVSYSRGEAGWSPCQNCVTLDRNTWTNCCFLVS